MIKPFPYVLALIGLVALSFVVHEAVHVAGADEPTRVCFGIQGNASEPFKVAGATTYYRGSMAWYGSEWAAYGLQVLVVAAGVFYLLRS